MALSAAFAAVLLGISVWASPLGRLSEQRQDLKASVHYAPPYVGSAQKAADRQASAWGGNDTDTAATPAPSPHYGEWHEHDEGDKRDEEGEHDDSNWGEEGIEDILEWAQHCFPGSSRVQVEGVGTVQMQHLRTGHRVQQARGGASAVFAFTHQERGGRFPFRRLCAGGACVTASGGHYVFAARGLAAAARVRVGERVQLANGSLAVVTAASTVWRRGLYNPQTASGELVVDGFRVSSFTTAVRPAVAHTLLAPLRAAHRLLGVDVTGGVLASIRAPRVAAAVLRGDAHVEVSAHLG